MSSVPTYYTPQLATDEDIHNIAILENQYFQYPYTYKELRDILYDETNNTIAYVTNAPSNIICYCLLNCSEDTGDIQILSITTNEKFRRMKFASKIMKEIKFLMNLPNININRIYTYVRESNLEAQLFFRSNDFTCIKIDHNFYNVLDIKESAYLFEYWNV